MYLIHFTFHGNLKTHKDRDIEMETSIVFQSVENWKFLKYFDQLLILN